MDKQLTRLLAILLLACGGISAQAPVGTQQVTTYYVDAITPGSDAAAGTAAAPFATVNHVASIAPQGNAVVFVKFPDLSWQQLQMPYLNLKLLFLGMQGTDVNKIYDVANGDHATAHNVTWLTSPTPKAFVCNGTTSYATFPTPVIGNSDFNIYIAAYAGTNGNDPMYSEFVNAGGSNAIWNAIPAASAGATGVLIVQDGSGNSGTISTPAFDTSPVNEPNVFFSGRHGAIVSRSILTAFGTSATPVTMSPNPTVTTDGGSLCGWAPAGVPSFFAGGTIGAIAVYNSFGSTSDQTNRYVGLLNAMTVFNYKAAQPLDPALLSTTPIWVRMGEVMGHGIVWAGTAQEPTVIYEGNPQVLFGNPLVFKLWFTCGPPGGAGGGNICYAESVDGLAFTLYSGNPLILTHQYSEVRKFGSTYYLVAGTSSANPTLDEYTSSDGVTWTPLKTTIMPLGAAGTVDSAGMFNSWMDYDGVLWRILYDCSGTYPGQYLYALCGATSTDGLNWTKLPTNPVNNFDAFGGQGPFFVYQNGRYWLWGEGFDIPGQLYRLTTQNFGYFVRYPQASTYPRGSTSDEVSQTADEVLVEVPNGAPNCTNSTGCTYMYYGPTNTVASPGIYTVKLAIAQMPISQIVTTTEGATTTSP